MYLDQFCTVYTPNKRKQSTSNEGWAKKVRVRVTTVSRTQLGKNCFRRSRASENQPQNRTRSNRSRKSESFSNDTRSEIRFQLSTPNIGAGFRSRECSALLPVVSISLGAGTPRSDGGIHGTSRVQRVHRRGQAAISVQTTERGQHLQREDHLPRRADVVQQQPGYLAVRRRVPVDAVGQPHVDVSPHFVVEVDNVEAGVGRRLAAEVVGEQHVVAKNLQAVLTPTVNHTIQILYCQQPGICTI